MADIFDRACTQAGCHAEPVPQMDLALTPERFAAQTVGVPSVERPDLLRVHPGRPDSSYLVMKVQGSAGIVGTRMPVTGAPLSDDEVAAIEAWVRQLGEAEGTATERNAVARAPAPAYPFYGWKVMNLPTTRTLTAGSWLFLIGHRFNPPLRSGYEAFYGLDGAGIIYLSLGYAVTDRLLVALGRSNAEDDVELQTRLRLVRQRGPRGPRGWPLSASLQGTVNWITEAPALGARLRSDVIKPGLQLSLARAFGTRAGLAVVPGVLFNPDEEASGEPPLVTIGLGGRYRVHGNVAVVAEWVPIVSGFEPSTLFGNYNRFDSWGAGLEISTSGHVFQIVVANAVGLTSDHYLRGGDLDVLEGELRLGFNIFRVLNF